MILTLHPSSARRSLRSPSTPPTACMSCRSAWHCKFAEGCLIQPTYSTKRQGFLIAGDLAVFFFADGAQSQSQQFLRLQDGINIAGITLRIIKGSSPQRFGDAGRLYAQCVSCLCHGSFSTMTWSPKPFSSRSAFAFSKDIFPLLRSYSVMAQTRAGRPVAPSMRG